MLLHSQWQNKIIIGDYENCGGYVSMNNFTRELNATAFHKYKKMHHFYKWHKLLQKYSSSKTIMKYMHNS